MSYASLKGLHNLACSYLSTEIIHTNNNYSIKELYKSYGYYCCREQVLFLLLWITEQAIIARLSGKSLLRCACGLSNPL
jgi:hypothetical protein